MGSWDNLPYEILDAISVHARRTFLNAKSMAVNKQWYNFYLARRFRSVSLRLEDSNSTLKQILTSTFQPGQWTKCIKFNVFKAVPDLNNIDFDQDLFDLLIKKTPHVEKVKFPETERMQVQDWAYFSIILMNNDWQLISLPETWNNQLLTAAFYYNCAYHVRHTLKRLNLTLGMLPASNVSLLKEFTDLTSLEVGKNLVKDVLSLDPLLRNTVKLVVLDVDFSNTRCIKGHEEPLATYPNIQKITFIDFTPQSNSQLAIFTDNFIGLKELYIVGEVGKQWPSITVDLHTQQAFYKTLYSLREFQITVPGIKIDLSLFNKQFRQDVHLSISCIPTKHHYAIGDSDSVMIGKIQSCSSISIRYQLLAETIFDSDNIAVTRILSNLDDNVQQIEFRELFFNSAGVCLNTLFKREHVNLRTIILSDFVFNDYPIPEETVFKLQHAKTLRFYNCKIAFSALAALSTRFTDLDYIHFNTCSFLYSPTEMNSFVCYIWMEKTNIDTLCISEIRDYHYPVRNIGAAHSHAVITVRTERAYYNYQADENAVVLETTKDEYDSAESKANSTPSTVVINIYVRSIKTIILKSPARKKDVCIDVEKTHFLD